MLELNHSSKLMYLSFTVFPETAVFFRNSYLEHHLELRDLLLANFPYDISILPSKNIFQNNLTINQNLSIVASFFKRTNLIPAFLNYFDEDAVKVLTFFQFFCKESKIWLARIEDDDLSYKMKIKIAELFSSKLYSQGGVIFYSTTSGIPLEVNNQIEFSF